MVIATWGRGALALREGEEAGVWRGASVLSAFVKTGAQEAAEIILNVASRNLRRFMNVTSEQGIQPVARAI